jgi:hypothetical protein
MSNDEKKILRAVVNRGDLFSPADLINDIAQHDRKSVENLIVRGYLEEVPQDMKGVKRGTTHSVLFYRATEKGLLVFSPWYSKIWHAMKDDIRTVVISAITALITSAIAILIGKMMQ